MWALLDGGGCCYWVYSMMFKSDFEGVNRRLMAGVTVGVVVGVRFRRVIGALIWLIL